MTRYLVVANQTLAGAPLDELIRATAVDRGSSFHVVVPATPPRRGRTWTEGEARALAHERLAPTLAHLRRFGIRVDGEVGDADPMLAVDDALRRTSFDVIVLSTLPAGLSRWLRVDLPRRMRTFGLPVVHLVPSPVAPSAAA